MSIRPNTSTSFFLDDDLIDITMLNYESQKAHNGANLHRRKQAITKLSCTAQELFNGYESPFSEADLKRLVQQAAI